jgi:subtilisin family serine protease
MVGVNAPAGRSALDAVNLTALMERTAGRSEVIVGLIDGSVAAAHADLATENIRVLSQRSNRAPEHASGTALTHGTFVAGILAAKRGTAAPAICPGCTLVVRPIFLQPSTANASTPSASPQDLAEAIIDCVEAGVRILNLSLSLATVSPNREPQLVQALDHAAAHGTLVVAAAGNQGTIGGSAITRHPWVTPVVACDVAGRPLAVSNLGSSIARRGLMAPGEAVTSLGVNGQSLTGGGTSAATPFVTGTLALLLSIFPEASAAQAKLATTRADVRRAAIVPPMLDAWSAYQTMLKQRGSRSHGAEENLGRQSRAAG